MDATRILFPVFPLFPPFDTSYVENVIRKLKHLHCEQGRNWPILKGGGSLQNVLKWRVWGQAHRKKYLRGVNDGSGGARGAPRFFTPPP